jgi:RNA polymerase sigma-70 factor (ECF subfamily)
MIDVGGLYAEFAPHVFRFALYLSGNRATAEDLTSETFIRLWTASDVTRGVGQSVSPAICRNLYLQELRRRPSEPLDAECPDSAPSPEVKTVDRDELRAVLRRLRDLPEIDRAAVLMRAQHELSYQDIAVALNMSVVAAKVRVHRARVKLAAEKEK